MRLAIIFVVVAVLPRIAGADDLATVRSQPTSRPTSYRAQLVGLDLATAALVSADPILHLDGNGIGTGLMINLVGAPLIHAVHGEWGRVGGSVALRYGLAAAGWMAGAQLAHDDGGNRSATMGLLLGAFTGAVIDDLFQATEREQPARWSPRIAAGPAGAQVGIGGAF
jgi:hypothetical protein